MAAADRSRCFYCGQRADPRLGGRPKCQACLWTLLAGGVLMLAFIGVSIWNHLAPGGR